MQEGGAGEYVKLPIKRYEARELKETAEGKYWRQFRAPLTAKQVGAVTSIHFSPSYPHDFAVTSSTRVLVYDAATRAVKRTFSRFKDVAYSGVFRSDGRLLAAGSEDGVVQVFDSGSRALLRQLKAHRRPVHVARFAPDRLHVLSGGDDAVVRLWDVTGGLQVTRLDGHTDYVRAAQVHPSSGEVWATGSYDHSVRLWDTREGRCSMELAHGAPVESLAFLPSGSLLVTAGGTHLCVWDLYAGGRLLHKVASHQKTITSVVVSPYAGPESSAAPRLLSASLDGLLKVYELDTFSVTHAARYPSPILSAALSPDCRLLATGMADGLLSVRQHARPKPSPLLVGAGGAAAAGSGARRRRYAPRLTAASFRFFIRGQSSRAAAADYVVAARKRAALASYDRLLRRFHYREALDAALATRRPEVFASVAEELARRGGLDAALGGRGPDSLPPLLDHLRRHISDPRHSLLLSDIAHRVLDLYGAVVGRSADVDAKLRLLRERVMGEVKLQQQLMAIQGMLEPMLAASLWTS
eukprot:scaffold8.g1615.t1